MAGQSSLYGQLAASQYWAAGVENSRIQPER
jgi:hypothetical protein